MKKTKFFAFMACVLMSVAPVATSCTDDDDDPSSGGPSNNWTVYQNTVTEQVRSEKQHSKAILLVAFGSTWQAAFDAFDATKASYKVEFGNDYDVYLSFSSAICINRAAAAENTAARNYYAPNFWLHAFGEVQYDEILVQSLQVIPGEEFNRVINYIKDFANNYLGDLDDAYLSRVTLKLGSPLLTSAEGDDNDVDATAQALYDYCSSQVASGDIIAYMGHGNPDNYDSYKANVRYTELEEALQRLYPKFYVGTVDMPDNYKNNVYDRMQADGLTSGKMQLYPLMSIAGDHANNDLAGVGSDYWDASDPDSEENSWYMYFTNNGYTATSNLKGLLSVPAVLDIWMKHTREAVDDEGLEDYYHSMFPEAD